MSVIPINGLALQRRSREHVVPTETKVNAVQVESVGDDPEEVLRHHLREVTRLTDRLLRFQEGLAIATEVGFFDRPDVAVKALQALERTRSSVAHDLRESSRTLNTIILDRYRARYPGS